MRKPFPIFVVLSSLFLALACQALPIGRESNKEFELMENEQLYAVRDTGQIVVDNDRLRIGVGNFMQETYTNQSEEQLSGATAGLWLFFRDSPSSDYQFRVYQGLTFEKGGYVIRIIEINKDDGVVVIGVAPSSQ